MVYKPEQKKLGLSIKFGTYRKHGNGAVGGGRKDSSGKRAVVSRPGEVDVTITGGTSAELAKELRKRFNIPSNISFSAKGTVSL